MSSAWRPRKYRGRRTVQPSQRPDRLAIQTTGIAWEEVGRSGIGNRDAQRAKLVLRELAKGSANPTHCPFTPMGVEGQLSQQDSQYDFALSKNPP